MACVQFLSILTVLCLVILVSLVAYEGRVRLRSILSSYAAESRLRRQFKEADEQVNFWIHMNDWEWDLMSNYTSCSLPTDKVLFSSLQLQPDPIQLPGSIFAEANFTSSVNLTWPMPYQKGSCDYDNWCQIATEVFAGGCPANLESLGLCQCPYKSGDYRVPLTEVFKTDASVPDGDYRAEARLNDPNDVTKQLGCVRLESQVAYSRLTIRML